MKGIGDKDIGKLRISASKRSTRTQMPDHSNLLHNLVLVLESIYSPCIYLPNEVSVSTPAVAVEA